MKKEVKEKIVRDNFKSTYGKMDVDTIMPVLATTLYDLFRAEKRIKKLKMWNLILITLVVLDLIAFWLPKLIK